MNIKQSAEKLLPLIDFYELALANGYIMSEIDNTVAWFDIVFRPVGDRTGFCIMAGLEQAVEYIEKLSFSDSDIIFLRENGMSEVFLEYLESFEFACDIWAVPEGTPVFPNEPVIKVKGPIVQAQLIEAILMLSINHQTLVATKANRIVRAAQGRSVIEFADRKAQGFDSALYSARAAYIGGCSGTSCAAASKKFGITPFSGMSHAWIQSFDSELDAFCAYARQYPDNCILLIDTYDILNSGMKNALETFRREILPRGCRPRGVRIESGDLAYNSKRIRRILNEEGFPDCDIIVSNKLDEYIIKEIISNNGRINAFLVGEKLISAQDTGFAACDYKLTAIEKDGKIIPKMKLSENVTKMTAPCPKLLWRLFDKETGKAIGDLLTLEDEVIDENESYELFDPDYTWKRKKVSGFVARQLLVPVFEEGKPVYKSPGLDEIRLYCAEQVDSLWEEVLRFEFPHNYYVDLSQKLWNVRQNMIMNNEIGE